MSHLQPQPLQRHKLFETTDLDEAREIVGRVFCPHKLELVGRQAFAAVHNHAALPGSSLNYIQYGADVRIEPGTLGRFYLLQIPLSGRASVTCGRHSAVASVGAATLLSPTLDVAMDWSWDCRKLLVQIEKERLEQVFEAIVGRRIGSPIEFDLAFPCESGARARILGLIELLREDLEDSDGVLSRGIAGSRISEALLVALLNSQPHSHSRMLEGHQPTIAPRHVKKAEQFMREHLAEPIGLIDLAEAADVSIRALQQGFRRFRDTTPLEMLRKIRMEAARAELLAADSQDTVTTIAMRWGFSHLSRFSGSYRQRYRETPSETMRRGGGRPLG